MAVATSRKTLNNGRRAGTNLSGSQALLALEDVCNRLLFERLYRNVFWEHMLDPKADIPLPVFYGMCIENYHFLFREAWFDAPVLSLASNTRVRVLLNEFFHEEYAHDELLLKSLESLGLTREAIFRTPPLRQTMALCNGLSFWARYDPILFCATLGILEGRDIAVDSFVLAAERRGLPESFIGPMRTHANINKGGEHGALTRRIFAEFPALPRDTVARVTRDLHLFVQLYDDFYTGIWNHYSDPSLPGLARPVTDL
jgi:hypothetical protein